MLSTWPKVLTQHSWLPQFDGQGYHVTPNDPGGATSWGITEMTWKTAVSGDIVPNKPLADATKAQCAAVLRALYWNALSCSNLPPGIDSFVFDMAMLRGQAKSVMTLQHILNVSVDGIIGAQTIGACDRCNIPVTIEKMCVKTHLDFVGGLAEFREGWMARLAHLTWFSLGLAYDA